MQKLSSVAQAFAAVGTWSGGRARPLQGCRRRTRRMCWGRWRSCAMSCSRLSGERQTPPCNGSSAALQTSRAAAVLGSCTSTCMVPLCLHAVSGIWAGLLASLAACARAACCLVQTLSGMSKEAASNTAAYCAPQAAAQHCERGGV